jgi:outer membrane protein TolC
MTPDRAVRETDEAGTRLATAFWQSQTGSTNVFDVNRAADALTLRIALLAAARGEQGAVFPSLPEVPPLSVSNGVLTLSLAQAMCVAARNDRTYQKHKEAVFSAALDLDYQQYQFETTFSGLLLATLSGEPSAEKAAGSAEAGAARTLSNGAKIAAKLALDVASLLQDDWRSVGVSGDLTMTVPLLRGAGREIVREPLTQAERDLASAVRTFERYRQTYAVAVASAYLGVLEAAQKLSNAQENERRLDKNGRRAEMMFDAGRMQRIQVDQARSDLLGAGESVIATRKNYEAKLDAFKLTVGLPPEARIGLDAQELVSLERQMVELAKDGAGTDETLPDAAEACRIALDGRLDLENARSQLEDAARAVQIAADALRADVSLTGKLSLDRIRRTGESGFEGEEAWSAGVQTDLPWNRRKERNTFKKRLIALELAKRTLEAEEDAVKQAVRNGLRNVFAARASFLNQGRAMRVALLRVESNNLYLQSGRSSMRDVLEAESSLLSARNALCSAVILWRVSELELRRDMGVLRVSEEGLWRKADGESHG